MSQLTKVKKPSSHDRQAEVFDAAAARLNNPVDPNFRWITSEGESIHPTKMSTWHLFNSIRMIWNHHVPPEYHFIPFKPYFLKINRKRRAECVRNLFNELMNRVDRNEHMNRTLQKMAEYIVAVKNKKIPSSIFYLPK